MTLSIERRKLITGIAATLTAPALVRVDSLMKLQGDRYSIWTISCPILPPIGLFSKLNELKGSIKDFSLPSSEKEFLRPYCGPNGNFYMGTWTYFGPHKNIYTDKLIDYKMHEWDKPIDQFLDERLGNKDAPDSLD